MRYIQILLFLFIAFSAYSQDQLLLTTGKSFNGKIKIDQVPEGHETITIKVGKNKTKLAAHEFKYFTKNNVKYIPFKLGQYYKIMRVDVEGYLSLYYYRDESYDFGTQFLYKADGDGLVVPNISFKKRITSFLNDCSKIEEGLNSGDYKKTELDKIVLDYNDCIKKKTIQERMSTPEISQDKIATIDKIDIVLSKIEDGNDDLKTLLSDIQEKLAEGKKVPDYLKDALTTEADNFPDLSVEILELLNDL